MVLEDLAQPIRADPAVWIAEATLEDLPGAANILSRGFGWPPDVARWFVGAHWVARGGCGRVAISHTAAIAQNRWVSGTSCTSPAAGWSCSAGSNPARVSRQGRLHEPRRATGRRRPPRRQRGRDHPGEHHHVGSHPPGARLPRGVLPRGVRLRGRRRQIRGDLGLSVSLADRASACRLDDLEHGERWGVDAFAPRHLHAIADPASTARDVREEVGPLV